MKLLRLANSTPSFRNNRGISLIETVVIVVIIGLIASIAVPSWIGLVNNQRIRAASTNALSALRLAQAGARRENLPWTIRFRTNNGRVQWTAYRSTDPSTSWAWTDLTDDADLIEINTANTNLSADNGEYLISFAFNGQVFGTTTLPQRITFRPVNNTSSNAQRCLRVETLLGATSLNSGDACNS